MLVAIQIHYLIALIVLVALIVGLFTQFGRRVALWSLGAQLLAGLTLVFMGFRPNFWHPVLWLATALLTQAAIITGKLGKPNSSTVFLVVLALCCAAGAFYVGLTSHR
jgi:hypothetical protein